MSTFSNIVSAIQGLEADKKRRPEIADLIQPQYV